MDLLRLMESMKMKPYQQPHLALETSLFVGTTIVLSPGKSPNRLLSHP
jgi:hypothetical protein